MDRKLVGLMLLFFLAFGVFTTVVVFNQPLTQLTRAKEETVASASESLIFAWPLTVKADGKTSSIISVFIRNLNGKPLSNKAVVLTSTLGNLSEASVTTDNQGKATFQLTSLTPGVAQITATVSGEATLTQKVTVSFQ